MHNPDQNLPSSETLIYVCNEEAQDQAKNIRDHENLQNLESSVPEGAPGSLQSPKVQFPCHLCHQNFSRKSLLKLHRKSHQLSKPYNCKECSSGFNNLDNFLLHMVTHKTPPVRCPTCKVEFQRRSSIRGHIKLHFKSENLTCAKCEGVFSFQMDLQEHSKECLGKERVPAEKPFECSVCQKTFGKKSVLNRHLLIHTGKKPFRCDICRQTFTQKSSLVVHKVIHTGDRPHQCPKCSLSFIQKTNLQCHLKRLHSSDSQKFPCKECSCSFRKLSALSLHVKKIHQKAQEELGKGNSGEDEQGKFVKFTEFREDGTKVLHAVKELREGNRKVLECNFCQRKLEDFCGWLQHRQEHVKPHPEAKKLPEGPERALPGRKRQFPEEAEEKKTEPATIVFQCSRCPLSFSQKTKFTAHLRQHNRELSLERKLKAVTETIVARPHQCTICPMRFTKNCHLREHLMRHQNIRPFQCAVCGKTFSTRTILEVHGRCHTGQKPYCCLMCDRMFTTASACRRHAEVHSVEKKYECQKCRKRFKTQESFRKHSIIHDGMVQQVDKAPVESENTPQIPLPELTDPVREEIVLQQPLENIPEIDGQWLDENQPKTFIVILDDQNFEPVEEFLPVLDDTVRNSQELSPNLIKISPVDGETDSTTIFSWTPQKRQKPPEEEYILPSLEPIALPAQEIPQISEKSRNEKNYKKCPNCSKKFIKPIDLRRHLRTHTGERPFRCEECGKSFSLESTLRNHRRIHSNDKPKFTCVTCLKDFSSKDNLKTHLTVHTGVKSFECLYCDKRFRTLSNRNAHHSTHLKKINSTIQAEAENSLRTVPSSREVLSSPETLTEDPENPEVPENLPPLIPIQSQTL
ncbi:zinc finger protein 271-like [Phlebotomus papatasi]|uniref:zinc finger protein 271-like n=1 Tax=Phlebotomus papatasi TaxID=29031 RepID=UPI002483CCB7|nr:zinc finger protein 271-like [Phlebotomus papatasi]